MLLFGKILGSLAFPPGLFILALAIALGLLAIGRKRLGLGLGIASLAVLYLISTQPIADLLIAPLENSYPPLAADARGAAVAVLGGDTQQRSPNYGGKAILGQSSSARAAYGAALARERGIPLYYSGGAPFEAPGAESGAAAALRFWEGLGLDPRQIRLEGESKDTTENALFLEKMAPPEPLIVVTSAYHMRRSVLAFRKTRMAIVPAPSDFRRRGPPYLLLDFLPSIWALDTSYHALHEYVGLLYYSMK